MTYIDLKNLLLSVRVKIVKADGSDLVEEDRVALANNSLHTIFSQVDVNVQQQPTSEVGANYAYKAYLDTCWSVVASTTWNASCFSRIGAGTVKSTIRTPRGIISACM